MPGSGVLCVACGDSAGAPQRLSTDLPLCSQTHHNDTFSCQLLHRVNGEHLPWFPPELPASIALANQILQRLIYRGSNRGEQDSFLLFVVSHSNNQDITGQLRCCLACYANIHNTPSSQLLCSTMELEKSGFLYDVHYIIFSLMPLWMGDVWQLFLPV